MSEPRDMIVPMLQEMRQEIRSGFSKVEERLTRLEAGQKTLRQAMTADTLFSKLILGDFEERLALLEARMDQQPPEGTSRS